MNREELIKSWIGEECIAHIKGWNFSHIHGKYEEENDLPWDYKAVIQQYITSESKILDIDTGGGEFLLSLNHPNTYLSATEAYPPNVQLCKDTLLPLGIDFREADGNGRLPFENETFDMVINRHGDYNADEICRVLKPGGIFITQQVGAENDRELVEQLLSIVPELPFPEQYLHIAVKKFKACGMSVIDAQEAFRKIRFFDVGALVWFAHIIEWEFPGFTVEGSLDKLLYLQEMIEQGKAIEGRIHRFLLAAKKPMKSKV